MLYPLKSWRHGCACVCVSTWGSFAVTQGRWPAVCWLNQRAAWLAHPASGPRGPSTGTWIRGHCCLQRAPQTQHWYAAVRGVKTLCKRHYMFGLGSAGCFLQGALLLLCTCISATLAWSNVLRTKSMISYEPHCSQEGFVPAIPHSLWLGMAHTQKKQIWGVEFKITAMKRNPTWDFWKKELKDSQVPLCELHIWSFICSL